MTTRSPSWETIAHQLAARVVHWVAEPCANGHAEPDQGCANCRDNIAYAAYLAKLTATGQTLVDPFEGAASVPLSKLRASPVARFPVAVLLALVLLVAGLTACQPPADPVTAGVWAFPAHEQAIARCVIMGESGGDPRAHTPGTRYWGLFQIGIFWRAEFERVTGRGWDRWWSDPGINGAFAYYLRHRYGWSQFSTADDCGA